MYRHIYNRTTLLPLMRTPIYLLTMTIVVVTMVVIMLMLPRRRRHRSIPRNKLVQKVRILSAVVHKSNAHLLDTSNLCTNAFSYHILDAARLCDSPRLGHTQLNIHEVVLASLYALDRANIDGLGGAGNALDGCGGCAAYVVLHFLLYADIGEFEECLLGVAPAGLNDHEGDDEAADGVEPLRVVEEVGAGDEEEGDECGEGVDAVVVGV
jgi:hypothetical protein